MEDLVLIQVKGVIYMVYTEEVKIVECKDIFRTSFSIQEIMCSPRGITLKDLLEEKQDEDK